MKKLRGILLVCALAFLTMADDCGGPPPPPPVGFSIHTVTQQLNQCIICPVQDQPNIFVQGRYIHDQPGFVSNGSGTSFNQTTDGHGMFGCASCRDNAVWNFLEGNGPCAGQNISGFAGHVEVIPLTCQIFVTSFNVNPSSMDLTSPGPIELTGSGINATYGMPLVRIYDVRGRVVAEARAEAASGDGTWLRVRPNVSGIYTGSYGIQVLNLFSDGSFRPFGSAKIDLYGNDPPPPPPPPAPCTGRICPVDE